MIAISEIAYEIYNRELSPIDEKIFIDSIWFENEIYFKKILNNKITFRKYIAMEKIKIEEGEDFYIYLEQIYKSKYMYNFTDAFKNKYQNIEDEVLKISEKLKNSITKKSCIKLKTLMKNCGYKRRSKEFNHAIKDIFMKHNLRILYEKNVELDIEKIHIDRWITIILIS